MRSATTASAACAGRPLGRPRRWVLPSHAAAVRPRLSKGRRNLPSHPSRSASGPCSWPRGVKWRRQEAIDQLSRCQPGRSPPHHLTSRYGRGQLGHVGDGLTHPLAQTWIGITPAVICRLRAPPESRGTVREWRRKVSAAPRPAASTRGRVREKPPTPWAACDPPRTICRRGHRRALAICGGLCPATEAC